MHQDVVAQICVERGAAASSRNRTCVSGEPIPETRHKSVLRKRGSGKPLNRKFAILQKCDYGESRPELRMKSALQKCGSDGPIDQKYVTNMYYKHVFAMYLLPIEYSQISVYR